MKRFFIYILLVFFAFGPLGAKKKEKFVEMDEGILSFAMHKMFIDMPDTLFPYLGHRSRAYLVEAAKNGMNEFVDNTFGGKSTLKIVSDKHLHIIVSEEVGFDMLVYQGGYLWVTTICSPACYSRATLYSIDWLQVKDILPPNDSVFVKADFKDDNLVWVNE